jgi:pyruvate,water dikinase
MTRSRFLLSVPVPQGAENWRTMYPEHLLASAEISQWENQTYWFHDSVHHPEVKSPFDTVICEALRVAKGQWTGRAFALPGGFGTEVRIVNGYVYLAPVPVTDPRDRAERAAVFEQRSAHYFQNWDQMYQRWLKRVDEVTHEAEQTPVPGLPEVESEQTFLAGPPQASSRLLLRSYGTLIDGMFDIWQSHFELLTLGYAAYYNLHETAKRLFPGITDQTINALLAGHEGIMQRPYAALRDLAAAITQAGLADSVRSADAATVRRVVASLTQGRELLAELEDPQGEFASIATDSGLSHASTSWRENPESVWRLLAEYTSADTAGSSIPRAAHSRAEAERIARELAALVSDLAARADFERAVALARQVTAFVEDHSYYVENRFHLVFWRKMRAFSALLERTGFLDESEDFFAFSHWEAAELIYEAVASWGTNAPSRLRTKTREQARLRNQMLAALRTAPAPADLGAAPTAGGDPAMRLLFGIGASRAHPDAAGQAASPGRARGKVRIVADRSDLTRLQQGDIVVARAIPIGWSAFFGMVAGLVTEVGGVLSHVAIMARELGVPAVVGVPGACTMFRDGELIEMDGTRGEVRAVASPAV